MHNKTLGIAAAVALSLSASAMAEQKVVNFYNWSDYMDPALIPQFEQETGIKVNLDYYDSNEVLEAKLMTGGSGYDVVVPTGSFLERQAQAGVYMEIDRSKLSNVGNIDQVLAGKISGHDPDNRHNVPYAWGTIGLGYNEAMIKERLGDMPANSLDLIFKPEVAAKLADCGIALLDSPAEMMSIALNYLGLDPNSEKKSDLKKATALMVEARSNYRYFNSSKYISDLANGEICLAVGYNGDVLQAASRAEEAGQGIVVKYAIPKEGTVAWFDLLAIPADAPHPEEAHQLIDFLLRAESGAGIANYVFYAVANSAAEPLLLDEVKNDPGIYPSEEVKANLFTQNAHTSKYDRILTRAWTNIKTGR
ncbi:polyamine ABC transporter substrate-binding protein [Motiliproteus sp.]|uniref:polyamine ABC transporter substrate-binding protein n=1 Tax=Motiliproteus sp. TaxID=1898955 RepID=UPI003BAD77F1